jgi:hypothetical protein
VQVCRGSKRNQPFDARLRHDAIVTAESPVVHCWCPDALAASVEGWDPDADPTRHPSGVGKNLLELSVRLRGEGLQIELAERSHRPADLVLVAAGLVRRHQKRNTESALRAVARARGRLLLVRADAHPAWRFPVEPTIEVVPNRGMLLRPNQRWVPPLPQRGVVPRAPSPIARVERVAIKCNPDNLPARLRDPAFASALRAAGADLWLDVPAQRDGPDQRWHDFQNVDAVLCVRSETVGSDWIRAKPATRLINAWVAGCIPVAAREPAYEELATDGVDACFIDDLEEIPALVQSLNARPELLQRLEAGVNARRLEFEPGRVAAKWARLVDEAAHASLPGWMARLRPIGAAWSVRSSRAVEEARLAISQRRVSRQLRA